MGAKVLVQNNWWDGSKKALYSTDAGYAQADGNVYNGASTDFLAATVTVPYTYTLDSASSINAICNVTTVVGNILSFA